jgi:glucose-1-phosphate thymidylyltransferase
LPDAGVGWTLQNADEVCYHRDESNRRSAALCCTRRVRAEADKHLKTPVFFLQVMKVIIPVAGKATRLRPATHSRPKPLIHVAGKPVLAHILDKLKRELPQIKELIFITGPMRDKIEEFLKGYDYKYTFVEQKVMDGTAGAIGLAEPYCNEPVLIIFVDTIFDADLGEIEKCDREKNDGVIWVKEVEDYQRFGIVMHKNWLMTKIVEKPSEPMSRLANIGLYYIRDWKGLFEKIHTLYARNLKTKGEYFLTDAFELMIQEKSKIKVVEVEGWYDCGKAETLLETNRILLEKRDKEFKAKGIDPSTGGKDAKITHSVIIPPVAIEEGCEIAHSIIGPNVSIAKNAKISQCIISDSIISERARLKKIELVESLIGEDAVVEDSSKKLNVGDHSEIRIQNEDSA